MIICRLEFLNDKSKKDIEEKEAEIGDLNKKNFDLQKKLNLIFNLDYWKTQRT